MFNPHHEPSDANHEVEPGTWESSLEQLDAGERNDGIDYGPRQACGGGFKKTKADGEGIANDPPVCWKRKRRTRETVPLAKADLLAKYRKILAQRYGIIGKRRSMAEGADPRNPASWTSDHEMPVSVHDDVMTGLLQGMIDDLERLGA